MNKLQIFKNEAFGEVRVTEVIGELKSCLADVCKVLSIVVVCLGLVFVVWGLIDLVEPKKCYYTIDAHYSNGDVLRLRMKGYSEPRIFYRSGGFGVRTELEYEFAVIRYDLVRVDTIKG